MPSSPVVVLQVMILDKFYREVEIPDHVQEKVDEQLQESFTWGDVKYALISQQEYMKAVKAADITPHEYAQLIEEFRKLELDSSTMVDIAP